MTGRGQVHAALERQLAQFEGTEAALLFPSGFAANLGTVAALVGRAPQRIGLSATQKPIRKIADYLCGGQECAIVDTGHQRPMDIRLELPGSPLAPVLANEVWEELYEKLVAYILAHRTTLIFVNTRRLAERLARHLAERLGETAVTAHHGSLSRTHRLQAEQALKSGQLKALVATASLELGIDIGHVDSGLPDGHAGQYLRVAATYRTVRTRGG